MVGLPGIADNTSVVDQPHGQLYKFKDPLVERDKGSSNDSPLKAFAPFLIGSSVIHDATSVAQMIMTGRR